MIKSIKTVKTDATSATIDITYILSRVNTDTHVEQCCVSVEVLRINN